MIPILPTNDVTYLAGGLVVGYDGLLWPVEEADTGITGSLAVTEADDTLEASGTVAPAPSSGNRMGGTGAIRRRGGQPR